MNPRVEPGLSELMLRMLARRPEERPSAAELAGALEQVASKAGASADRPLFQREEPVAAVASAAPVRSQERALAGKSASSRRVPARERRRDWAAYAACVVLGAIISAASVAWGLRLGQQARGAKVVQPTPGKALREEEPVGLGDTNHTAPAANDQRRAPHCVPVVEATIHGGCWVEVPAAKPPCKAPFYEWQGSCYVPSFPRLRQPTSEPP